MSKSKRKKRENKKKEIEEIVSEIRQNDETIKKNYEQHDVQVMVGLMRHHGYNPSNPIHTTFLDRMETDLEETGIKLDGIEVINPMYKYQTDSRWIENQKCTLEKHKSALIKAIAQLKENIADVEQKITEQNERWRGRRVQLVGRLKELGSDVSEFEKPDYIG